MDRTLAVLQLLVDAVLPPTMIIRTDLKQRALASRHQRLGRLLLRILQASVDDATNLSVCHDMTTQVFLYTGIQMWDRLIGSFAYHSFTDGRGTCMARGRRRRIITNNVYDDNALILTIPHLLFCGKRRCAVVLVRGGRPRHHHQLPQGWDGILTIATGTVVDHI
jgi:hypothetical protein